MTEHNNEIVTHTLNCDYCNDVFYSDNAFARLCPKCYEEAKHTTREEIEQLKEQKQDLCESLDIMNNRESELLEQIAKFKAELEEARKHCKAVDDVNAKLRCCDNCTHVKYDWEDQLRIGKCKTCISYSNWEMRA